MLALLALHLMADNTSFEYDGNYPGDGALKLRNWYGELIIVTAHNGRYEVSDLRTSNIQEVVDYLEDEILGPHGVARLALAPEERPAPDWWVASYV